MSLQVSNFEPLVGAIADAGHQSRQHGPHTGQLAHRWLHLRANCVGTVRSI